MKKLAIFAFVTTILPVVILTLGLSMGWIPESVGLFFKQYGIYFVASTIIVPIALPIVIPMMKARQRRKAASQE